MGQIDKSRGEHHNELKRLRYLEDKLEEEIGNLHHELRRVRDAIERAGGWSHSLEPKARQLLENIKLCERDLKENRKRQVEISRRSST